ncbi:MAG: RsmB/NOP family class I SAM-dependent RNA methyltransferase [Spirochaetales bacterium]|nr:RsmB/NOP family class I SAM-dependent RNA methyltransferase [Spirochaetales bacterium]
MAKKDNPSGSHRFNDYYGEKYGQRWAALKEAMLKESHPILLSDKLVSPYYMDQASIIAADILPISENYSVLDMCAAPGGKTLVIALRLNGTGSLVSNDRSAARRNRLLKVLDSCLSQNLRSVVKVTGHDSSKWSLYEKDMYDCVLLDAPCSSERHVINDSKALDEWSSNRPKMLSKQQFAMLCAALDAAKNGGYILYSTCSICDMENEEVIERLFKKRENRFEEVDMLCINPQLEICSEKLSHGRIILPDVQDGLGPLYFCLIRKLS